MKRILLFVAALFCLPISLAYDINQYPVLYNESFDNLDNWNNDGCSLSSGRLSCGTLDHARFIPLLPNSTENTVNWSIQYDLIIDTKGTDISTGFLDGNNTHTDFPMFDLGSAGAGSNISIDYTGFPSEKITPVTTGTYWRVIHVFDTSNNVYTWFNDTPDNPPFHNTTSGTTGAYFFLQRNISNYASTLDNFIVRNQSTTSFTNPQINNTIPRENDHIQLNITISDSIGLDYFFQWNNSGSFVNDTSISIVSDPQIAILNKTVTATAGNIVGYRWVINESSQTLTFQVAGTEPPALTLNPNNFFSSDNNTEISVVGLENQILNLSFTDDIDLFGFQINISNSSGDFIFNRTVITLSGTSDIYSELIDIEAPVGISNVTILVADSHTATKIPNFNFIKEPDSLTFDGIKITAQDAIGSDIEKKIDRYNFQFQYSGSSPLKTFIIESPNPLHYVTTSGYNGHFVDWKLRRWIDFEGGGKPTITKISDNKYKIEIFYPGDNIELKSIGGLNERNYRFSYSLINDHVLRVDAVSALNGSPILNFDVSLFNSTYSETISTTNGNATFNIAQGQYTLNWTGTGYARLNANITINSTNFFPNYTFTVYDLNSINFTFVDEEDLDKITDRPITVEIISDSFSQNYTSTSGALYVNFLSPDTYLIRFSATDYNQRDYYFNLQNGSNSSIVLYMINSTLATQVTGHVLDQANKDIEGAYIKVLRYRIDQNAYTLREIYKTDVQGEAPLNIIQNTEFYKFIVEQPFGTIKLVTEPAYIIDVDVFFQILNTDLVGARFFNSRNIARVLSFNNNTHEFSITYSDPNNLMSELCFNIYRVTLEGKSLVNQSCVQSAAGSITLKVANISGATYVAEAIVGFSPTDYLLDAISHTFFLTPPTLEWGGWLNFMLTLLAALTFLWSVPVAIVATTIPTVVLSLTGIINLQMIYAIALFAAAVITAALVGRKQ